MNRLKKAPTTTVLLDDAGHYPLEQPGLDQLIEACVGFVRANADTAPRQTPSTSA
jgi:hypothetical protein